MPRPDIVHALAKNRNEDFTGIRLYIYTIYTRKLGFFWTTDITFG